MNPRERIIATLEHKKPDRIPIQYIWRDEVTEAVKQYYKVETAAEVARILEADLYRQIEIETHWPDFEKRINGELYGPFGQIGETILHDERTFEDPWGVLQRVGSDGKYLQWIDGPFAHNDDLDAFPWPTADSLVHEPVELAERVSAFKADGYWVCGTSWAHPFKQAWLMRGLEKFLCDYVANPEWVAALQERLLAYNLMLTRVFAAADVDMIQYWGDVAMQNGMMVSPKSWQRLDKQFWKQLIQGTREVNPDIKFFFHSDGDTRAIIPDLIEVGFDIINPLQPECMNPALIKQTYGKQVTLDGGGSVQRTLPYGTIDDVKREVEFLLRHCAYDGGYIFSASNTVSFDSPTENIVAFYETARDFDLSQLEGPPTEIPEPPCRSIGIKN